MQRRRLVWSAVALLAGSAAFTGCGSGDGDDESRPLTQTERVEQAKNGVVSITGKSVQVDEEGNTQPVQSGGSGIVVDAGQGLVLTNDHVVAGMTSIRTQVAGAESPARVQGRAPCQDLAVIKMTAPPRGVKNLRLGNSDQVRAGQHVTALGYPGDLGESEDFADRAYSATEGTVSVPKTEIQAAGELPRLSSVIRHQAPISGGNSGGPLINDRLEVVGINTLSGDVEEANVQSQNIAIASNAAKTVLPDLIAGRNIAYVGWDLDTVGDERDLVMVEAVDAGSPADNRDFNPGDVVLTIDEQPVDNKGDVCEILESKQPSDKITVSGYEPPYEDGDYFEDYTVRLKE